MAVYALGDAAPRIDPSAYVHPQAVVIGDVTIGPESSVWPGAVVRADDGLIVIGARTSIQDGAVLHTTPHWPTVVGDDCVVGHLAHLEGCTLEDLCLVGSGAVVLHRAVVETGALVGAGALVTNDGRVPSGAMALGVPYQLREGLVDADKHIRPGAEAYVARTHRYRAELTRLD